MYTHKKDAWFAIHTAFGIQKPRQLVDTAAFFTRGVLGFETLRPFRVRSGLPNRFRNRFWGVKKRASETPAGNGYTETVFRNALETV